MGRRKNPVPVKRGRVSLSFNLSDPTQRYTYNYLVGNRGKATKIVVDAIIAGQATGTKKATEFVTHTQDSVADIKPSIKVGKNTWNTGERVSHFTEPEGAASVEPVSVADEVSDDFLEDALDAFGDA